MEEGLPDNGMVLVKAQRMGLTCSPGEKLASAISQTLLIKTLVDNFGLCQKSHQEVMKPPCCGEGVKNLVSNVLTSFHSH